MYVAPRKIKDETDEFLVVANFVASRMLFGSCYRILRPDYFEKMPRGSGVFVSLFSVTADLLSGIEIPGDIDLLIVPYEGNELVLSEALAIECKVVRASFAKQGKSPNQMGFRQANGLVSAGFPLVGVLHLIVSDTSPQSAWPEITVGTAGAGDTLTDMREEKMDILPKTLIERATGKLRFHNGESGIGIAACYPDEKGHWVPDGQSCIVNMAASTKTMDAIFEYYSQNYQDFIDIPRYG